VPSLRALVEEPLPLIKVVACSRSDDEGLDRSSTTKGERNNGPDEKPNAEGNDLVSRAVFWGPGNGADGGAGRVDGTEQRLACEPLLRRWMHHRCGQ
jgi:hypothetical protein